MKCFTGIEERMFAGRRGESVCRRGVLALGKVCGLCFGEGVKKRWGEGSSKLLLLFCFLLKKMEGYGLLTQTGIFARYCEVFSQNSS